MSNLDDLKFIRILNPYLIPREIVDQVKNKPFSTEEFYVNNNDNSYITTLDGDQINPLNHLYAITDPDNHIKGVLWCTMDGQECTLQLFSIEKDYWNKGEALKFSIDILKEAFLEEGIKKYIVHTNKPSQYEKIGFNRSPQIKMELEV